MKQIEHRHHSTPEVSRAAHELGDAVGQRTPWAFLAMDVATAEVSLFTNGSPEEARALMRKYLGRFREVRP